MNSLEEIRERDSDSAETWFRTPAIGACGRAFIDRRWLLAEIAKLRGELSLAEEGLANYAQENAELRKLTEWQSIETAPRDVIALFCVVPLTAEDDYFVDTSGFPILGAPRPPRVVLSKRDCGWSSLEKAILWMPVQPLPQSG